MIIPIGIQCLNHRLKDFLNKKTKTLPFDWMLSNPKFVYHILKLLLEDNINIEELVNDHFFYCEKLNCRANSKIQELYYIEPGGFAIYNSKYDVIFPHDKDDDETQKNILED